MAPSERRNGEAWASQLAAVGVIQLCSLRALAKYLSLPPCVALLVGVGIGVVAWFVVSGTPRRLQPWLESRATFWLLGVLVLVVALAGHPFADGLREVMRGSDADDALILGAHSWLHDGNPYSQRTYLGNALSPGPGWIALWAPLSLSGLYPIGTPLLLVALCWLVGRAVAVAAVETRLLLLALSGLGTWEMLVVGGDYLAIGFAFAILAILIHRDQLVGRRLVTWAFLLGLVLTSRVIFIYLAGVFVLLLLPRWQAAARVALVAGGTALALHLSFWCLAPAYPPLHLLSKPALGSGVGRAVLLLTCLAYVPVFWRARSGDADRWLGLLFGALVVPLAQVALTALWLGGGDLANWEASNYLLVCVGPALAWYGLRAGSLQA